MYRHFTVGKMAGVDDDHSPPFGAKVKNGEAIPPLPPYGTTTYYLII
jgi:hypothetical protein